MAHFTQPRLRFFTPDGQNPEIIPYAACLTGVQLFLPVVSLSNHEQRLSKK